VGFLAALQFLTSIPVSLKKELSPAQIGRTTAWFPAVGLLIGVMLALLDWLLLFILPTPVVNVLLIIALVLITGALHLDGLADTCDGLAGHREVEERWRVMRDGRTGAFGVIGVILVLIAKYALLNGIPSGWMLPTLVFLPMASRWAMVYAIFAFPYARPEGLGTAYKQATHWPQFTIATTFVLVVAAAIIPFLLLIDVLALAGIWIITTLFAFYLKHKLAGLTGDTYGAINEVAEVTALLVVVGAATVAPGLI
jgi:adenosylcobinamide-GDP ribazoletransferase